MLATAASLAVSFSEPAAAESVPPPWVVAQMQVAGVATPIATVHPSWSVKKPGCVADLSIGGAVATGTSTRLTADWTSRPIQLRRLRFSTSWSFQRNMVIKTLPEDVRMTLRARFVGGRWFPWFPIGPTPALKPPTSSYLDQYGSGGFSLLFSASKGAPLDRLVQIEWRLQEHLTSTSTVLDSAEVKLDC
jgi:hypothetical protein